MINLPDAAVPLVKPDGRISEAWYPILRLWANEHNTAYRAFTRRTTPVEFDDLPAAPTEGMEALVKDSNTATWGAVIAGGGANRVLTRFNGSDWTVSAI